MGKPFFRIEDIINFISLKTNDGFNDGINDGINNGI
jgi:hypothetical protein